MEGHEEETEEEQEERLRVEEALSKSTLEALQEFLRENASAATNEWKEDFSLSQFWYSDETARLLATELLHQARGGRIGLLSAPKAMMGLQAVAPQYKDIVIFEFDRRFGELYPEHFQLFDFNHVELLPNHFYNTFDVLLIDPPYLNEETLTQYTAAVRRLARQADTPVLAVTGTILRELLYDQLRLRPCDRSLTYKSKFATPMTLYSNTECACAPWATSGL